MGRGLTPYNPFPPFTKGGKRRGVFINKLNPLVRQLTEIFVLNPFRDYIFIENEIEPAPAPSPFLERGDGE